MIEAKIIAPGEPIPSGKVGQVFRKLNDMLELWALDKLTVIASVLEDITLVAGQAEYSWGVGGDVTTDRPIRIEPLLYLTQGTTDYRVALKDLDVYRGITVKNTRSRPQVIAYNPEYPLFKFFMWPTPDSAYTLKMKSWKQLVEFEDKTTVVDLPPGYAMTITSNLALLLCNPFGKKASSELKTAANTSYKNIKRANVTPVGARHSDLAIMTGAIRQPFFTSGPFV